MPSVSNHTPAEVRKMNKEIEQFYFQVQSEVTLQELSRCRQAVRDGTIWRLAEKESSASCPSRPFVAHYQSSKAILEPLILDEISASKETGEEKVAGKKTGIG